SDISLSIAAISLPLKLHEYLSLPSSSLTEILISVSVSLTTLSKSGSIIIRLSSSVPFCVIFTLTSVISSLSILSISSSVLIVVVIRLVLFDTLASSSIIEPAGVGTTVGTGVGAGADEPPPEDGGVDGVIFLNVTF